MNEKPTQDRLPIHSVEAEAGVIGCVLQDPDECLSICMEQLQGPEAFYDLRHRTIYQTMLALQERSQLIDIITLSRALTDAGKLEAVGGLAYIAGLPDSVPSASNISYYLAIVREKHLGRRIQQHCASTISQIYEWTGTMDEFSDNYEKVALEIRDDKEVGGGSALSAKQCVRNFIDDLEWRSQLDGKLSGLGTGFYALDSITDGLQFGEQAIIGGRPSQGKTAIGVNIVDHVCLRNQVPTAIFSFEMSHKALMRRLCSAHSNIPLRTIRSGSYDESTYQRFHTFSALAMKAPLFIYDRLHGATADRISAIVRRLCRKHGVRFVLIDYLQKIKAGGRHEKRTYEVGEVSGVLKNMAVENNIALLTLAQLNREPEKDKGRPPRLSDLADSAQIERDADTVMLLNRNRQENGGRDASLIVAKQRDGETGIVDLSFVGEYCRFENRPLPKPEV